MLTVSHLTKRYKKLLANDDLSFTVGPGEITVLAGPNGAGKSTAIKCIAGLLRYEGSIRIGPYPNKQLEAKRMFGYHTGDPGPLRHPDGGRAPGIHRPGPIRCRTGGRGPMP